MHFLPSFYLIVQYLFSDYYLFDRPYEIQMVFE